MALEEYRKKRDFERTPEPAGAKLAAKGKKRAKAEKGAKAKRRGTLSFVIQKHAATRLHYDFRLEMEGVLRSWAVPKGPSLDPGEKRLAVAVEDHPIEYGGFEGIIPKGEYGGGTVLLWDRGTWHLQDGEGDDPGAAFRKGKIKFVLEGDKLVGGWTLVRMHGERGGENGENWLLIKETDETARPGSEDGVVKEKVKSVESGKTIEQIAAAPDRVWKSNRAEKAGAADVAPAKPKAGAAARKAVAGPKKAEPTPVDPAALAGAERGKLPHDLAVELATLVAKPPQGDGWLHEIKYDGYRALCEIDGAASGSTRTVRILTRNGKDWTDRFAPVAEAARALPVRQAILDGEVVVLQADGKTSFQALQNVLSEKTKDDLVYFAFDLLYLDGFDLRAAPLSARKEALAALLAGATEPIRLSDHVVGRGDEIFRQACKHGIEGIIAKRADAPYRGGRGRDWVKVKCVQRQEMVVGGFTDPQGARVGLGALHLGFYEDGELVYAGKVGTGFDDAALSALREKLDKLPRQEPPFRNPPKGVEARGSHWVTPRLVAEVEFAEWTREGFLRHPTFLGLREDKAATEVVREKPVEPAGRSERGAAPRERKPARKGPATRRITAPDPVPDVGTAPAAGAGGKGGKNAPSEVAGVRLTHPDKLLYPADGLTKRDVALYYEQIADWILPHIANRPLTLVRCPDGQPGECFYQKHVGDQFPDSIERVEIDEGGGKVYYGAVRDVQGLVALLQMGALELHIWGSHTDQVERPDYLVFDLDPDVGLDWARIVEGARLLHALLAELGLQSFLKTTGGKGLHIVVPLTRRAGQGWDEVKAFTKAVAEAVATADPGRYTTNLQKARRKDRIFIDYLRNGRGATSISAYSTRAREGAPVSAPLHWEELDTDVRANTYTVANLPARLEKLDDPWAGFKKVRQSITPAIRKRLGMEE